MLETLVYEGGRNARKRSQPGAGNQKLRQVEVAVAGGKSVGQAVRGIDLPPIPVPLAMLVRRPVSA